MKQRREHLIIFLILLITLFAYFFQYIFNVLLSRNLSPALYGDIYLALRVLTVVASLMLIGSDVVAKRFLSIYFQAKDSAKVGEYIAWCLKIFFISTVIVIFLNGLIFLFFYFKSYIPFISIGKMHMVFYMLWLSPIFSIFLLLSGILLSFGRFILGNILGNAGLYLLLFFGFFVLFYSLKALSERPIGLLITFLLVFLIVIILHLINFYFIFLGRKINFFPYVFYKNKNHVVWKKAAIRVCFNNITFMISSIVDIVLIEIFGKNEEMTGYYSACLVVSGLIWAVVKNIQNYVGVSASTNLKAGQHAKLQKTLNEQNLVNVVFLLIINSLVFVFSKQILSHFGPEYVQAQSTLLVLMLASSINAICRPYSSILLYSGYEGILAKSNVLAFIVLLLLGIPGVYFYSILGLAFSLLVSILFYNMLASYYCSKAYPKLKVLTFF